MEKTSLGVFFKGSCSLTPQKTWLVVKEEKHGFLNNTVEVIAQKRILPLRHKLIFVFRSPGEYKIDFIFRGSRHGFSITVTRAPMAKVLKSWDFEGEFKIMIRRADLGIGPAKEFYVFYKENVDK